MTEIIATDARRSDCEAFQASDQMVCKRCNMAWDMNDIHPPKCAKDIEAELKNLGFDLDELLSV